MDVFFAFVDEAAEYNKETRTDRFPYYLKAYVLIPSKKEGVICLSDEKFKVMMKLHDFSAANIYKHKDITRYQDFCKKIIDKLFDYLVRLNNKWNSNFERYANSPGSLDRRFGRYLSQMQMIYQAEKAGAKAIVRDYIVGMTDDYAIQCMKEISLPEELSFDQPLP